MRHVYILSFCLLLCGCSIIERNKQREQTINQWREREASEEFKKEKALFQERLGGKYPCWLTGISYFSRSGDIPDKKCLYPTNKFFNNTEAEDRGNAISQEAFALKVIQATPDGFLVNASWQSCSRYYCSQEQGSNLIFIYKTDEKNLVDGSILDPGFSWSLYEYTGPFSYRSVLGMNTVHSFKKVSGESLIKAKEGLTRYNSYKELLATLGLWKMLGEEIKQRP